METKTVIVNSFPKDRDYRREAIQSTAATTFTSSSKCYIIPTRHLCSVTTLSSLCCNFFALLSTGVCDMITNMLLSYLSFLNTL